MVDHVKSTIITNLDATPPVTPTAGEGAFAHLKHVDGFATVLAASVADSTYQLCRIPSNCKVKRLVFESEAQGAGKVDIGLYYATDGRIGKPTSLLAANAIDQDFFATVIDLASAVKETIVTNESGSYTVDKRNQPIWQAVGLSVDPGGNFDIVATVKTTDVTTGTGKIGLTAEIAN